MQFFKDLWGSRELLGNLILRETRGQYKRTILGRLWSLLNPLALMLIYTFVFSVVLRLEPEPGDPSGLDIFPIWLMCGLLPWAFFAGSINVASNSLVVNMGLITKVYFPRAVLPLAAVGTIASNWIIEICVLVAALFLVGSWVLPWLPGVVLLMIILGLFACGIGLATAVLNVYFRDTQYLLGIILQLWMYLTPIIYPSGLIRGVSDSVGGLAGTEVTVFDLYTLNPMYHFVSAFRQLLYDNRWPDTTHLVVAVAWTVAALLIGMRVFARAEKRIAEVL